ncbi:MAG: hypothetical protein DME22_13275 [Verrucomicrobia bacterium]|nr:MAG: hypothetical protein DME22_13275 [Verrucomicrobiota bacterium]
MDQPGEVTDAKTFFASLPHGDEQHQAGSNPGQSGEAGFGKRGGEQKSGEDCRSMTWIKPRKKFHPAQLAAKRPERKLQKHHGTPRSVSARPPHTAAVHRAESEFGAPIMKG